MLDNVLIHKPYPAIRVGDHLFRETTYGIVKRLRFFVEHIEAERHRRQLHIKDLRILDIGYGTGINVAIVLAEAGYQVVGIDTDRSSIKQAGQNARVVLNASLFARALAEWEASSSFHAVVCLVVLEYVEPPKELVRQMRCVLDCDGHLLVTVPNGYGCFGELVY